jgi:enamine deaminase RidA (YjgF/YER057c/UK114 family)
LLFELFLCDIHNHIFEIINEDDLSFNPVITKSGTKRILFNIACVGNADLLNGLTILLISGTASIDEHGRSVHAGDFRAQCRRTFWNITQLLQSEGATWKDIVRTSCYLRDIERDYEAFNEERTAFYCEQELDPVPASTGIQAILCRPELLVEIEAIAMFKTTPSR